MIEGEGAGKGDTYRNVKLNSYGRNLDRALCPKTSIGVCPLCGFDIVEYRSQDYRGTFCTNPKCSDHIEKS